MYAEQVSQELRDLLVTVQRLTGLKKTDGVD